MPSRAGLHRRLDALQATGLGAGQRRRRVDWSLVIDAELDRLEGLAMQAETFPTEEAFWAALAPDERGWLDGIGARLGIVLAVDGRQA